MREDIEDRIGNAEPIVGGARRHTGFTTKQRQGFEVVARHVAADASDCSKEIAFRRPKVLFSSYKNDLYISLVHQHRCSARHAHKRL